MRENGWVICAFDAVTLVVWEDCWVGFEVVGGEDGVVERGRAVADTVEDFGGHERTVEEGGAAIIWMGDFRGRFVLVAAVRHVFGSGVTEFRCVYVGWLGEDVKRVFAVARFSELLSQNARLETSTCSEIANNLY